MASQPPSDDDSELLAAAAGAAAGPWTDQSISDATLERLARDCLAVPADHDLPSGRWIVVRGASARQRVGAAAFGQVWVCRAPVLIAILADLWPERVCLQGGGAAERTPAQKRSEALARRAAARWPDRAFWACRHAVLTLGRLLAESEALGLLALPVPDFDHDRLREALGIPDDHAIAGLVAIGPGASSGPTVRSVATLEHCVFADHFGQPWPEAKALDPS